MSNFRVGFHFTSQEFLHVQAFNYLIKEHCRSLLFHSKVYVDRCIFSVTNTGQVCQCHWLPKINTSLIHQFLKHNITFIVQSVLFQMLFSLLFFHWLNILASFFSKTKSKPMKNTLWGPHAKLQALLSSTKIRLKFNIRWFCPQPFNRPLIFTVVAEFPGLWLEARLPVTLFWYKPLCFSFANAG